MQITHNTHSCPGFTLFCWSSVAQKKNQTMCKGNNLIKKMFLFFQRYRLWSIPLTACEILLSRAQPRPQQSDSWRRRVWAEGPACRGCSSPPPPYQQETTGGQRSQTLTDTAGQQSTITHMHNFQPWKQSQCPLENPYSLYTCTHKNGLLQVFST